MTTDAVAHSITAQIIKEALETPIRAQQPHTLRCSKCQILIGVGGEPFQIVHFQNVCEDCITRLMHGNRVLSLTRFDGVDTLKGCRNLAAIIILGAIEDYNAKFINSTICADLCEMIDIDHEVVMEKFGKRARPGWWKLSRRCCACYKPITDWNKSGYCSSCSWKHEGQNRYSLGRVCSKLGCGLPVTNKNTTGICKRCVVKGKRKKRREEEELCDGQGLNQVQDILVDISCSGQHA